MKGFNIACWLETQTAAGADVAAIADAIHTRDGTGDGYIVKPEADMLLGVGNVAVTTPTRGYVHSATLDGTPYHFEKGVLITYNVPRIRGFQDWFSRPYPLKAGEPLFMFTYNPTNEYTYLVAFMAPEGIDRSQVDAANVIYNVRLTGTTTVTANAWATCPLTLTHRLPVGEYYVVGMRAYGDLSTGAYGTNICGRLVFTDTTWRPGVLMEGGHSESGYGGYVVEDDWITYQKWPKMDDIWFEHDKPPALEVISGTALNKQEVFLELERKS